MTQTICPQEIRIANKRSGLGTIWQSQEWRDESTAYKARHPPVCSRCGCVGPIVPGHSGEDYSPAEMQDYIGKVRRDEVVPLCRRCNKHEAKGRHPCEHNIGKQRCQRAGRVTICPYSVRNAASKCDPDHFKAREKKGVPV